MVHKTLCLGFLLLISLACERSESSSAASSNGDAAPGQTAQAATTDGRAGSGFQLPDFTYDYPYSHCHDAANAGMECNQGVGGKTVGVVSCQPIVSTSETHTINWVHDPAQGYYLVEPQNGTRCPATGGVANMDVNAGVGFQCAQRLCLGQARQGQVQALPAGTTVPTTTPDVCANYYRYYGGGRIDLDACSKCCSQTADKFGSGPGFKAGTRMDWQIQCQSFCNGG